MTKCLLGARRRRCGDAFAGPRVVVHPRRPLLPRPALVTRARSVPVPRPSLASRFATSCAALHVCSPADKVDRAVGSRSGGEMASIPNGQALVLYPNHLGPRRGGS